MKSFCIEITKVAWMDILKIAFKNDPKALSQIKKKLKERDDLVATLGGKVNYFSFRKYSLDKQIKDDTKILNVIENGLKYGNSVDIKVEDNKDKIVITIDDDGPGIPDKEKERVLRPFYRLDKSRTSSSGSVGLGLSIVQDIVNSHGGQIKLLNNPKGSGLRVNLIFPS